MLAEGPYGYCTGSQGAPQVVGNAVGARRARQLPVLHIPTALLFFSLGVESGHFLFIGVVMSLIALARRVRISFPRWTELVPPYAIGTIAMFWVIQRLTAF